MEASWFLTLLDYSRFKKTRVGKHPHYFTIAPKCATSSGGQSGNTPSKGLGQNSAILTNDIIIIAFALPIAFDTL